MSNVLYIDANRQNSMFHTNENNEWQTKLNTETLLPKGTGIQIQTSFINKKGINGGSIEIDEDIIETISYYFYITEQAHLVSHYGHQGNTYSPTNSWVRSSLACDVNTFRGNFGDGIPVEVVEDIVYGEQLASNGGNASAGWTYYNGQVKTPDFLHYGGTSQILPQCKWVYYPTVHPATTPQHIPRGDYVLTPDMKTLTISVPAGVYGIGELSQLVEDQMNGIKFYDPITNKIYDQNNTYRRRDAPDLYNVDAQGNPLSADMFDGQMYNKPIFQMVDAYPRYFQTSIDKPEIETNVGGTTFITMNNFTTMANYLTSPDGGLEGDMSQYPLQGFTNYWMKGSSAGDAGRLADLTRNRIIRPFYMLRVSYDDGATGVNNADGVSDGHQRDGFISNYNIYQSDTSKSHRKKLIGSNNFSFKYDSEKNGYSLNGLHNCVRSPSHDRYANKIVSSGQTVINFKKIRTGGLVADYGGDGTGTWTKNADGTVNLPKKVIRNKLIGALNTPETRDMGIMIVNFGLDTAKKHRTNKNLIPTQNIAKFSTFFNTVDEAKEVWKTTLWYRLGFDYDQLNEPSGTNIIYDQGFVSDYGFTTDTEITNDIIPTISSQNNPVDYAPTPPSKGATPVNITGFQLFNNQGYASAMETNFVAPSVAPIYSNSCYYECSIFPVIISDVGGVIARRLPALSQHPYYLITTDLCDNYKDNVKKGDVLPLIGVVPKTSLSNQDFITAENQIVQVLSQDKVVNKFNIKILNPDLTAPQLEENSSIILKLTLPNITPLSLLQEDPTQKKVVEQIMATQTELVGN